MPLNSSTSLTLTRLDYLVTDLRFRNANSEWTTAPERFYHINPLDKETVLQFDQPDSGAARAVGFTIGVPPGLNHQDPARWPAGHPLNVLESNLHWSWKAGYVFLALEGFIKQEDAPRKPILYHIGNDPQLMSIELMLPPDVRPANCELVFHLDRVWTSADTIAPGDSGGLTHSPDGDTLAPRLARNIEKAFEIRSRVP